MYTHTMQGFTAGKGLLLNLLLVSERVVCDE